jgi:hypothetical protein
MCFIALLVAIALSVLIVYFAHNPAGGFYNVPMTVVGLALVWILAAFAPKALQKLIELWLGRALPGETKPQA